LLISKKYPINLVLLLLFYLFRCHWALIRVASQQVKKEASSKRVSGLLKGRRRYYYYQTYLFEICVNQVPSNQISSFAWDLEKAHGWRTKKQIIQGFGFLWSAYTGSFFQSELSVVILVSSEVNAHDLPENLLLRCYKGSFIQETQNTLKTFSFSSQIFYRKDI
jgi:hypothetical protein